MRQLVEQCDRGVRDGAPQGIAGRVAVDVARDVGGGTVASTTEGVLGVAVGVARGVGDSAAGIAVAGVCGRGVSVSAGTAQVNGLKLLADAVVETHDLVEEAFRNIEALDGLRGGPAAGWRLRNCCPARTA